MDSASITLIVSWSHTYGVPAWIPLCIAYAETSITPSEIGDNGTSYGLFQLHTPGGQGDVWMQYGSSPTVLLNPNLNAEIGVKPIAEAYKQGAVQGLTGFPLLQYTADHSGHPDDTGYMPSYYLSRLQLSFAMAQQQNWFGLSSNFGGLSVPPSSSPGTTSTSAQTAPISCPNLGVRVGEGTAVGVQPGLVLFRSTQGSTIINTVVRNSCTNPVAVYKHNLTPVSTPLQNVQAAIGNVAAAVAKPQNWWAVGLFAVFVAAGIANYDWHKWH